MARRLRNLFKGSDLAQYDEREVSQFSLRPCTQNPHQLCMRPAAKYDCATAGRKFWRSVRKVVAALILLWAMTDLTVPGVCQTDLPDLGSTHHISVSAQTSVSPLAPSRKTGEEDDCFCCCSHIVHSSPTTVTDSPTVTLPVNSVVAGVPRELAISLYHPPRY